jgi:hypothetical protein
VLVAILAMQGQELQVVLTTTMPLAAVVAETVEAISLVLV